MNENWQRMRRAGPLALLAALVGLLGASAVVAYFMNVAFAASPPPAPTITASPSNPTTSTSATFNYKDTQTGVTFSCSLDSASFTACASSGISYTGLADGSHTFKVRAQSGSNVSSVVSYSWVAQPPAPTVTAGPANPTSSSAASFKYSDSQSGVTFTCSLDTANFTACSTSGISYSGLTGGNHTFGVEAISSGQASGEATYTWTISVPVPTINSKPANPTGSTSAAFTYSDSASGATFSCSLDGSSYTSCKSSGVSYSGLGNGSHTFGVEASAGSAKSAATTYSWLVDTTPPAVTIHFPANNGYYGASAWSVGCNPSGICGTASDPSGVASVSVALLQSSSGKYWNGSAFSSKTADFLTASGTTSWNLAISPRPSDGSYTAYVRATDGLGNTTQSSNMPTAVFVIDSSPPAAPIILSGPTNPTTSTSAVFIYGDVGLVQFECSLDSTAFSPCLSVPVVLPVPGACNPFPFSAGPCTAGLIIYPNVSLGTHCFSVEAVDSAGNISSAAQSCWTVTPTNGMPFTISGNPSQPFYPGVSQSLNLTFDNPNSVPITVSSVTITVNATSSNAGCNGTTNLKVTQGLLGSVTVPASSTESLSALGIPQADWPILTMPNLPTNQDACAGARFSLTFTGTATGS